MRRCLLSTNSGTVWKNLICNYLWLEWLACLERAETGSIDCLGRMRVELKSAKQRGGRKGISGWKKGKSENSEASGLEEGRVYCRL